MTDISVPRASSAKTRQQSPTTKYGNNPSVLYISNKSGGKRYGVLGFTIPSVLLSETTAVASAELVFSTEKAFTGTSNIIVERVVSPAWTASKVHHQMADAMVVADPVTVSYTNPVAKQKISVDVLAHFAAWRSGAARNGWRIRTTEANDRGFWNKGTVAPVLKVTYYVAPAKPGSLSPNDQFVTVLKPRLMFQDVDPNDAAQIGLNVQISTAIDDWSDPLYDSPDLPIADTAVDLSTLTGVPEADDYSALYWRIRQIALGPTKSPWSDPAVYRYAGLGTVTITVPAAAPDNITNDPTPPVGWTFSGTQTAYQVIVRRADADPALPPLWNSGVQPGSANTVTIPKGVITGTAGTYVVRVNVWDDKARPLVDGYQQHASAEREFTFALSNDVTPVTNLQHVDMAPMPFSKLTWNRATAPDSFVIVRDGVIVDVVDAVEVAAGGTSYEYIDELAGPRRPHIWSVWAIVNNKTSAGNPTIDGEIEPAGIWLSDPSADEYITVITTAKQTVKRGDVGETFWPLKAEFGVRITSHRRGRSGTVTGELFATDLTGSKTGIELQDDFLAARERGAVRRILTMNTSAFAVIAYDLDVTDTPRRGRNGDYVYDCTFSFIEVE